MGPRAPALATEAADYPVELSAHRDLLQGRSVLVRKAEVVPLPFFDPEKRIARGIAPD